MSIFECPICQLAVYFVLFISCTLLRAKVWKYLLHKFDLVQLNPHISGIFMLRRTDNNAQLSEANQSVAEWHGDRLARPLYSVMNWRVLAG